MCFVPVNRIMETCQVQVVERYQVLSAICWAGALG